MSTPPEDKHRSEHRGSATMFHRVHPEEAHFLGYRDTMLTRGKQQLHQEFGLGCISNKHNTTLETSDNVHLSSRRAAVSVRATLPNKQKTSSSTGGATAAMDRAARDAQQSTHHTNNTAPLDRRTTAAQSPQNAPESSQPIKEYAPDSRQPIERICTLSNLPNP